MRLSTVSPIIAPSAIGSPAPRGALLLLPSVFETIYAGQMLKCLARATNLPIYKQSRLRAYIESGGQSPRNLGQATGQDRIDLLIKDRLEQPGPLDLIITCYSDDQVVLTKKYRIEVHPSLSCTCSVQVQRQQVFITCRLANVTHDVQFVLQSVKIDPLPPWTAQAVAWLDDDDDVVLSPSESRTFVFCFEHPRDGQAASPLLGRPVVTWMTGMGEDGELAFSPVALQTAAEFELEPLGEFVAGQPQNVVLTCTPSGSMGGARLAPKLDDNALVHGPLTQVGMEPLTVTVIPAHSGVLDIVDALGLDETKDLSVFVQWRD